jgi:hypothetical protein
VDLKVGWQLVQRLKLPRSQWVAFLSHTRVVKGHDQPPPKPKTKEKPSKDQKTNKQTKCDDNLTTPRTNPYNETPKEIFSVFGGNLIEWIFSSTRLHHFYLCIHQLEILTKFFMHISPIGIYFKIYNPNLVGNTVVYN